MFIRSYVPIKVNIFQLVDHFHKTSFNFFKFYRMAQFVIKMYSKLILITVLRKINIWKEVWKITISYEVHNTFWKNLRKAFICLATTKMVDLSNTKYVRWRYWHVYKIILSAATAFIINCLCLPIPAVYSQ